MSYKDHVNDLLKKAKQMIKEKDWKLCSENNGVKLESKLYPISPVSCFKASGLVNCKPQDLFNKIKNYESKNWKKYDPDILDWKIIEKKENANVTLQLNGLPWPLWTRRILSENSFIADGDSYWMIGCSVNHEKSPDEPEKYVTVKLYMSVLGFIPEKEKTRVWRIVHLDPAGYIPNVVINANAEKLAKIIHEWKKEHVKGQIEL